jgi:hypothetical protein
MDPKDHDILIEIKTQVTRLISDVKELKDDTARRVEVVEQEKLSKEDFDTAQIEHAETHDRHQKAIETLRDRNDFLISKYWWLVGIGSAITFAFGLIGKYILDHLP